MSSSFGLILLVAVIAGALWGGLAIDSWKRAIRTAPHQPVSAVLWFVALWTMAAAGLGRVGFLPEIAPWVGPPVFAVLLVAAVVATPYRHVMAGPRVRNAMVFGLLSYSFAQLTSAFLNDQFLNSRSLIAPTIGLVYLPGIVWVVAGNGAPREQLWRLAWRVSSTVVGASLVAAVAFPDMVILEGRRLVLGGFDGRLAGLTYHPTLLALVTILTVALTLRLKPRWSSLWIGASAVTILLAESRLGIVLLAVALVVHWMCAGSSPVIKLLLIVPLLALPVLYANEAARVATDVLASPLGRDLGASNDRVLLWKAILEEWPERFWFGWGPHAFNDAVSTPFSKLLFLHGHNQVMHAVAEAGCVEG